MRCAGSEITKRECSSHHVFIHRAVKPRPLGRGHEVKKDFFGVNNSQQQGIVRLKTEKLPVSAYPGLRMTALWCSATCGARSPVLLGRGVGTEFPSYLGTRVAHNDPDYCEHKKVRQSNAESIIGVAEGIA